MSHSSFRLTPTFFRKPLRLLLGALFATLTPAPAAHFVVSNTSSSGTGSLSQAVLNANAQPGLDTIFFTYGSGGTANFLDDIRETINLTAPLTITDDLIVQGPGAKRVTISGNQATRVFDIQQPLDFDRALHFDGVDDSVTRALPALFSNLAANDFTFEAWVNPTSTTGRVFFAQVDGSNFATLLISGANTLLYVKISNITYTASVAIMPLNEWTHVTCRWNANQHLPEIFYNGVLQAAGNGGASSYGTNNTLTIGSRSDGQQPFSGTMDEVRIWRGHRTEEEIRTNQYRRLTGQEAGLVAYYDFDQSTPGGDNSGATTLTDRSPALNHGTLTNFALNGATSNWVTSSIQRSLAVTFDGITIARGVTAQAGSEADQSGGGIRMGTPGSLLLQNCVVEDNTAAVDGGGIYNATSATLTLRNSTLSGNSAFGNGGAVAKTLPGSLSVIHSTLSGNTANTCGGGIFSSTDTVSLLNSTLTNNSGDGGGIFYPAGGSVTLTNSIVAGNSGNHPDLLGSNFNSTGKNFIGVFTPGTGNLDTAGDKTFASTNTTIAQVLRPLASNGGQTKTHAPAPGSPVVDAGATAFTINAGLTSDQRGAAFDRFKGSAVDIGSVETPEITEPVSGLFAPTIFYQNTIPDFASTAQTGLETLVVTQDPPVGSTINAGLQTITLTAKDAGGVEGTITFEVNVRPVTPPSTVLARKGDAAPGAGGASGLPAGATLTSLSAPAIDENEQIAFIGKWATTSPKAAGTGLFTAGQCFAILGGDASALTGVVGSKFKTFSDPVISNGRIACLATFSGVPSAQASAVISDVSGSLSIVAQSGRDGTADTAKFKLFKAVSIVGNDVAFLAQLTNGTGTTPKTSATNDFGLWIKPGNDPLVLALREGQTVNPLGKTIQTLVSFSVGSGSPGQGRGWLHRRAGLNPAPAVLALATFTDKSQAVLEVASDTLATPTVFSQTLLANAEGSPSLAGATFASYSFPSLTDEAHCAFLATLSIDPALQINKNNGRGIFFLNNNGTYNELARVGTNSGVNNQATFSVLKDPVLANDGGVAFPATLKGGTATGLAATTLWWQAPDELPVLFAQAGPSNGGVTTDLPTGAQWKDFPSLAIAENRGPIFTGNLVTGKGGVTSTNASGVWATDFLGQIRTLFRTGNNTIIPGKTLASFSVLKTVVGSTGVTRDFNAAQKIIWLATFKEDKSQAIVVTEVP